MFTSQLATQDRDDSPCCYLNDIYVCAPLIFSYNDFTSGIFQYCRHFNRSVLISIFGVIMKILHGKLAWFVCPEDIIYQSRWLSDLLICQSLDWQWTGVLSPTYLRHRCYTTLILFFASYQELQGTDVDVQEVTGRQQWCSESYLAIIFIAVIFFLTTIGERLDNYYIFC